MKYLLGLCCLFFSVSLIAQQDSLSEETFQVVEHMPRFPGCEDSTGTSAALKSCADKKMLQFIYKNIRYPEIDRQKGNEGTVVIGFVVKKDGVISDAKILRDPGDQLGEEALRVVELMNEMPQRWTPGMQKGKPVNVQFNLPIKFRLEESVEPDFVVSGRDSIWIQLDQPLTYTGGDEALVSYIDQSLKYPEEGQDSCKIGIIEVNTLVFQDGTVKIMDIVDYSGLGINFQFEAIRVINSTLGKWIPATRNKRKVNTSRSIRILFRPNMVTCGEMNGNFDVADQNANEAFLLIQENKLDEGIAKLTEAIESFPDNGEFLSLRGQAYLSLKKNEEACLDLQKVKDILLVSWYDSLIPIICK